MSCVMGFELTLENLKKVYELLEDEESREIYLNRLNYLVTGRIEFIEKIISKYIPNLPLFGRDVIHKFLKELPQDKKFVLYGAGEWGKEVFPLFKDDPRFIGFCSGTKEKQEHGFMGVSVISPETLFQKKNLTVVVSALSAKQEILELLKYNGYPTELIFTMDDFEVLTNEEYFGFEYFKYEPNEVFVDAGSYNLATAIDFRRNCGSVKKVYAFEPDPHNVELCQENKIKHHFTEAMILPYGVWSEDTTMHFQSRGTSDSSFEQGGDVSVPVRAIDNVVEKGEPITFIKMDVEGSELEALKGAQRTIQQYKPKLAICIYHKPQDMTEIPLYIHSLVPEYRFYVRHHSNTSVSTVLYAIV